MTAGVFPGTHGTPPAYGLYTLTPRWARWQNSTNTMIMASDVTSIRGKLTNHLCFVAHNDFFFHTANQTLDSLHIDHSAVLAFHNCINLKTPVVGKQLMVCGHVTSSAKGYGACKLRSAYLPHTHMHAHIRTPNAFTKSLVNVWVRVCMYVRVHVSECVCMCVSQRAD